MSDTSTYTVTTTTRHGRLMSRVIRTAIGETGKPTPIVMVPGNIAPHVTGRGYYWTTLSGKTEVKYPGAYRWPTWYHGSTRKIVVGREWVAVAVRAA